MSDLLPGETVTATAAHSAATGMPDLGTLRVIVPVGMLGGGFPVETINRGITLGADAIGDYELDVRSAWWTSVG